MCFSSLFTPYPLFQRFRLYFWTCTGIFTAMTTGQQPRIYRSSLPTTAVVRESIFTYLMETRYHLYDPDDVAFVDADSEISISRRKLKTLALKLGYGLRNNLLLSPMNGSSKTSSPLARGDTVMIFSPNTMSWPTAVFGCVLTFYSCKKISFTCIIGA